MKRFVTYLYEYDRGSRGRNVGFVRTDIRDTVCRMELHIRGLDRLKGKSPVYFTVSDGHPIGVPVGEILISQGIGNLILTFPNQQIGQSQYIIDQLQALVIRLDSGKLLVGNFVKEPAEGILTGNFDVWTPAMERKSQTTSFTESIDSQKQELARESLSPEDTKVSDRSAPSTPVSPNQKNYDGSPDSPNLQNLEGSPDSPDSRNSENSPGIHNTIINEVTPEGSATQGNGNLRASSATRENDSLQGIPTPPESDVPQPEVSYRRIELTDIKSLPQRNWFLSNNRFVVHGFFNYHYLILKTMQFSDGRKRFLGVPGIYEQPERMMALLFGFPEFELSEEAKRSRPQKDADLTGAFGYWMCPVAEE